MLAFPAESFEGVLNLINTTDWPSPDGTIENAAVALDYKYVNGQIVRRGGQRVQGLEK